MGGNGRPPAREPTKSPEKEEAGFGKLPPLEGMNDRCQSDISQSRKKSFSILPTLTLVNPIPASEGRGMEQ